MTIFVIHRGSLPSLSHSRFLLRKDAENEVVRLNLLAEKRNYQIEHDKSTGRGSCFMNIKERADWNCVEMEVPE